jgi:hypothetical protein
MKTRIPFRTFSSAVSAGSQGSGTAVVVVVAIFSWVKLIEVTVFGVSFLGDSFTIFACKIWAVIDKLGVVQQEKAAMLAPR